MPPQIQQDLNGALARMERDVEAVCDLFGYATDQPSLLIDQLRAFSHALAAELPSCNGTLWTERALQLIQAAAACSGSAIRRCAECAFDDPDSRVRGVAWCVLAELEYRPDMGTSVPAIVAAVYKTRVVPPSDSAEAEQQAAGFALMVGGAVLTTTTAQMLIAIERQYIAAHGGDDARIIEANPTAAMPFLKHSDKGRRLAALRVVARAGNVDSVACATIYSVMVGDPDSEVRLAAIVAYTSMFSGTRNTECLRRTAAIVLDEKEPKFNRFAAYDGLFTVSGRARDEESPLRCADEERLSLLRDEAIEGDWPTTIDWEFVHLCACT